MAGRIPRIPGFHPALGLSDSSGSLEAPWSRSLTGSHSSSLTASHSNSSENTQEGEEPIDLSTPLNHCSHDDLVNQIDKLRQKIEWIQLGGKYGQVYSMIKGDFVEVCLLPKDEIKDLVSKLKNWSDKYAKALEEHGNAIKQWEKLNTQEQELLKQEICNNVHIEEEEDSNVEKSNTLTKKESKLAWKKLRKTLSIDREALDSFLERKNKFEQEKNQLAARLGSNLNCKIVLNVKMTDLQMEMQKASKKIAEIQTYFFDNIEQQEIASYTRQYLLRLQTLKDEYKHRTT